VLWENEIRKLEEGKSYKLHKMLVHQYEGYVKRCPVPGCKANPQVRLALHIQIYHPEITADIRQSLTKTAEVISIRQLSQKG